MTAASLNVPGRSDRPDTGSPLLPRQFEALRTYAESGDQRRAAQRMGIAYETHKNYMTAAYERLGVHSAIDAFRVMGWLRIPEHR